MLFMVNQWKTLIRLFIIIRAAILMGSLGTTNIRVLDWTLMIPLMLPHFNKMCLKLRFHLEGDFSFLKYLAKSYIQPDILLMPQQTGMTIIHTQTYICVYSQ